MLAESMNVSKFPDSYGKYLGKKLLNYFFGEVLTLSF